MAACHRAAILDREGAAAPRPHQMRTLVIRLVSGDSFGVTHSFAHFRLGRI